MNPSMDPAALTADIRTQFEAFLDEHRAALLSCLEGLTEQEARASLVPSRTTLLGLAKHAIFVEKVWFDEAITCRTREEIGIPGTPDESFVLTDSDTIAGIRAAYGLACEESRRGPLPWSWTISSGAIGAARCPCGGSTCTCSGSWPSTAATRTSCANKSSQRAPDAHVRAPLPQPKGLMKVVAPMIARKTCRP